MAKHTPTLSEHWVASTEYMYLNYPSVEFDRAAQSLWVKPDLMSKSILSSSFKVMARMKYLQKY